MTLCSNEICTLISKFTVPAEGVIRDHFLEYLSDHCAEGTSRILINTKGVILQNTNCPFCHFTATIIQKSFYADAPDGSKCFVTLRFNDLWLEIQRPGVDDHLRSLVGYSERIVLVTESGQTNARDGRCYDQTGVNFTDLGKWLHSCNNLHQEVCPVTHEVRLARQGVPDTLRVYDVLDNCLIDIPWTERYVALSYVWGNTEPPKLFGRHLPSLRNIGSLTLRRESMPRTIQNSMTLTASLGVRYLWFDSLCLVQDDANELKRGICNMDIVYESAYITVIAANGPGADSGLPGIDQTLREVTQQPYVLKTGLKIMHLSSLDDHLNKSTWASRGWTLQEHYLSRRTLNFVNGQAYFRCRQRIWCEELWTDRDPQLQVSGEWVTNLVALAQESMDLEETIAAPQDFLFMAVKRFQQRQLKYESDAINAMAGILQRVAQKAQTRIIGGLPIDIFPLSLNFMYMSEHRSQRRKHFPSWSWAGWTGQPHWYAFSSLDFIQHPEELEQTLNLTCAFISRYDQDKRSVADEILWHPQHSDRWFEPHQTIHGSADLRPKNLATRRHYELLAIKAVMMHVQLYLPADDQNTTASALQRLCEITASDGNFCGYAFLDETTEKVGIHDMELLLLSECRVCDSPFSGFEKHAQSEDPMFWAIAVIPMADGIYERRGMAQVLKSCVSYSLPPGPRWQTLILG